MVIRSPDRMAKHMIIRSQVHMTIGSHDRVIIARVIIFMLWALDLLLESSEKAKTGL